MRRVVFLLLILTAPLVALGQPGTAAQEILLQPDREVQHESELLLAAQVIKLRMDAAGISGVQVKASSGGMVHLLLDGRQGQDISRILELAQSRAQLEFRLVKQDSRDPLSPADLEDAGFQGQFVQQADYTFDEYTQMPLVTFIIVPDRQAEFGELTEGSIGRRLAVVLDGVILTAPVLQGRISDNGQISGVGTLEEARTLAAQLNGGVLPFALEPVPGTP